MMISRRKEELDLALVNFPLKKQAMMLEEQLQELRERRMAILAELNSEETPEVQREHFAQRIQRDNEEISHMQTQSVVQGRDGRRRPQKISELGNRNSGA
uniref:BMERB domain-containing protein n=1 Tax=Globodera pallida TaxID=36090 RepID=A0A183CAQ8_GLOPA